MRKIGLFLGMCAATALINLSATIAAAAELTVPGDHPTVEAAVAASSSGDTIRITDSGTYSGTLVIDRDLTIVADEGEAPVLRPSAGADRTIHYNGAGNTLIIGSAEGGRVIIESGAREALYGNGKGTITVTNVTFNGFPEGVTHGAIYTDHFDLNLTVDNVLVEGEGRAINSVYYRQILPEANRTTGGDAIPQLRILNSQFLDPSPISINVFIRPHDATTVSRVDVQIHGSIIESGIQGLYALDGTGPIMMDIEDSIVALTGGHQALNRHALHIRGPQTLLTATRSVFRSERGSGMSGHGFYIRGQMPSESNSTFVFDHCDIIGAGVAGRGVQIDSRGATGRSVTVKNSIVIAGDSTHSDVYSGMAALSGGAPADGDVRTSHNNSLVVTGQDDVLYVNWPEVASNFRTAMPLYYHSSSYDFRYHGPSALFTGSESGGPVGSNYDFITRQAGGTEPEFGDGKMGGAFYPRELIDMAQESAATGGQAAVARNTLIARATWWVEKSNEELWSWVFGPSITRSWMVWSDGEDPETGDPILMYDWEINALTNPWKVRSPVTGKLYPTNDFKAFHDSGLDERGFFDPALADRSILYNADHPDPSDPLHLFGVDDGEGYVDGNKRWRFIGAYLIYGQWKQKIIQGINRLSEAYMVTGDPVYARKAGILLDRIADIYPEFDFGEQGLVYENPGRAGTVSTWHDAAREVRVLAQAYDRVFDGMAGDEELVEFLSAKAEAHNLDNPKTTFADIQRNIEENIFRETLRNPHQIETNFPGHLITLLIIETVLEWPLNREHVLATLEDILVQSMEVDGLTGERGIQGYTRGFPGTMSLLLAQFDVLDDSVLPDLFNRLPDLTKTWRFHIDTKIMDLFYPAEGDSGLVGRRYIYEETGPDGRPTPPPHHYYYFGFTLPRTIGRTVDTCPYRFLWRLYELTGDSDYVKVMWNANDGSLEGLPMDVYSSDYEEFQQQARDVLEQEGYKVELGDITWPDWGISILRAGEGPDSTALSFLHHVGGRHQHFDGLNIELFHRGTNLLPDLGYPAVAFVNDVPRDRYDWNKDTSAHNTVVVDGRRRQSTGFGTMNLWADGREIHAVRVDAPSLYQVDRYERLVVMMEIGDNDAYIVDLFSVEGGRDHIRSYMPFFSETTLQGLNPQPVDFEHNWLIDDVATDSSPSPGWVVDWKYEDRYGYLEEGQDIHLRYTGLSKDIEVSTALSYADTQLFGGSPDWLPRLMERRRQSQSGLQSRFLGILEPHQGTPHISNAENRSLRTAGGTNQPDSAGGAVHVTLADGRTHVIAFTEGNVSQQEMMVAGVDGFRFRAEVAIAKYDPNGALVGLAMMNGTSLEGGAVSFNFDEPLEFLEVEVDGDRGRIITKRPNGDFEDHFMSGSAFSIY